MSVSHRFASMAVACCLMLVPEGATIRAATADPASLMPADTVLYAGWSNVLDLREQAQLEQVRQAVRGLQLNEQQTAMATRLLDLVPVVVQGPGCIGLLDFTITGHQPDIQVALVLDAGATADDLPKKVADLLAMTGEDEMRAREGEPVDGVPTWRIGSAEPHWEVLWGVSGERFFAALGEKAAARVIACMKGEGPSLADSQELQLDRSRADYRLEGTRVEIFANVPVLIAKIKAAIEAEEGPLPEAVDRAIQGLRVNAIHSLHVQAGDVDGLPRASMFVHTTGTTEGILALCDQQPLTDEDLKLVPADAYWAVAFNFDLKKFYLNLARTVREVHPAGLAMINAGMGAVIGAMGFTSPEQLYEMVGDTWILYDAPDQAGVVGLGAVLVAEIKNRESFTGITENARTLVNLLAEGKVTVVAHETSHGDHTIHYLLAGGVPVPVAPAWGFVGDRCVIGLFPQTVASAMNQLDPATRKSSLLDSPDFAASRKLAAPNAYAVAYVDAKGLHRLLYPIELLLQTAGVSQLAGGGMKLDLEVYPTFDASESGVRPLVLTEGRVDDGVLAVLTGGCRGTAGKIFAGAGAAAALAAPAATRARHEAMSQRTLVELRQIGMACQVYAAENNGEFPPTLDSLSEYGVREGTLLPAGGGKMVYIRPGSLNELPAPARTVVVYVVPATGGPIHAVFADGHTETVEHSHLEHLLREAQAPATPAPEGAPPASL